jgi:hypothetical protein
MSDEQIVSDGIKLAMTIIPTLTKHRAEVVDFALAQSLAYLLAGYHPDVRQRMLANHVLLTGQLVPRMDKEIYAHCERPRDWPPATTLGPQRDQLRG